MELATEIIPQASAVWSSDNQHLEARSSIRLAIRDETGSARRPSDGCLPVGAHVFADNPINSLAIDADYVVTRNTHCDVAVLSPPRAKISASTIGSTRDQDTVIGSRERTKGFHALLMPMEVRLDA